MERSPRHIVGYQAWKNLHRQCKAQIVHMGTFNMQYFLCRRLESLWHARYCTCIPWTITHVDNNHMDMQCTAFVSLCITPVINAPVHGSTRVISPWSHPLPKPFGKQWSRSTECDRGGREPTVLLWLHGDITIKMIRPVEEYVKRPN